MDFLSIRPLFSTYGQWLIYFIIITLLLKNLRYFKKHYNSKDIKWINLYLIWIAICLVRGVFEASNYWEYKSLVNNGFALLLIVAIYKFTDPKLIQLFFASYLKYMFAFFIPVFFLIDSVGFGYYLSPISFLILFFPLLSKQWKLFFVLISSFVILSDFDARSNVIKFIVPFLLSFLSYFSQLLNSKIFKKSAFIILFSLPFFFLALASFQIFNVFKMEEYISGNYSEKKIIDGESVEINLKADTRTALYIEVISSAINNDYLFLGRTPARGNDSKLFGSYSAESLKTGRYERSSNEVSILNILTWTGILGVILYLFIFLKGVYLSFFKSNNKYVKILGLYVGFRWIYAWVEDYNTFSIMNVILFISISILYSKSLRSMNNKEVASWFKGIFNTQTNNIVQIN